MDVRTYIGPPGCVEVRGPRGRSFNPGESVDFDAILLEGNEDAQRAPQTWGDALANVAHLFEPARPSVAGVPLEVADPEPLTTRDADED